MDKLPYTALTQDRLDGLRMLALVASHTTGVFAEVGVYQGGSLAAIAETVPTRICIGFDTFTGLPTALRADNEVTGGFECGLEQAKTNLRKWQNVTLVPGLFPESAANIKAAFAFAHIDVDFGRSVQACLAWFYPRLSLHGVMVFDDYNYAGCPNVKPVVDEFAQTHDLRLCLTPFVNPAQQQAFFIKTHE